MSVDATSLQTNRPSQLILIDDDSVFRLGLRVWLDQFLDLEVIAEAESGTAALQILARLANPISDSIPSTPAKAANLVILNLNLGRSDPTQLQGLSLCQQIKAQYPQLPVLLLGTLTEPVILAAAQQAGASGYCLKATEVTDLASVIRQVASGQHHWRSIATRSQTTEVFATTRLPGSFAILRRNLRRSSLQQIEAALAELTAQLNLELSGLDRAILAGQQRELLAARWLVKRLLATPGLPKAEQSQAELAEQDFPETETAIQRIQPDRIVHSPTQLEGIVLLGRNLQTVLFNALLSQLQTSLQNQTDTPLEIDILREKKKQELFYLILRKLEDLLDELRYSQIQIEQLAEKRSPILQDLWLAVMTDFFGKYYTVSVGGLELEVVKVLQQDTEIVQTAILDKIPFVTDLFAHLLFQMPLAIDGISKPAGSPEAMMRSQALLENLLIQVANSIVQPLLNRFATVETIKRTFYDRRLISSREVERFRNNLSWKYRFEQYVSEPKAIFESQYQLFIFHSRGINRTFIYAPRNQELEQLAGIQLAVTLALETRDAIAPRLRSAISLVGSGIIYLLTEVIGRGIGLIGRGILKGIGNAWQDSRVSRNGDRQK